MEKDLKLEDLPNISIKLGSILREAGITSVAELRETGAFQTFLRIRAVEPDACFSKLCALQGAIDGIRWHKLPPRIKEELKQWFNVVNKDSIG